MIKIITIIGARPQFVKVAAVSRAFNQYHGSNIKEILLHTGQHYDENMAKVFFDELDIPLPKYNLGISGGNHGFMTGRMLEAIEIILVKEKPDWVLVFGDTNSTLGGALAAAKLHIPIAHVEAGLRSFNMRMPEEINRILVDRISTLLLCPTDNSVSNLQKEGITKGVYNLGDVMFDIAMSYHERSRSQSDCLKKMALQKGNFALATCHREENTDNPENLCNIAVALGKIAEIIPVIMPLHPRTRKKLINYGITDKLGKVKITEPLSFFDMINLEQAAKIILTDSGGVQKEAFFFKTPCITLRDQTEWSETVDLEANRLAGVSPRVILNAFDHFLKKGFPRINATPYGEGNAAQKIAALLVEYSSNNI